MSDLRIAICFFVCFLFRFSLCFVGSTSRFTADKLITNFPCRRSDRQTKLAKSFGYLLSRYVAVVFVVCALCLATPWYSARQAFRHLGTSGTRPQTKHSNTFVGDIHTGTSTEYSSTPWCCNNIHKCTTCIAIPVYSSTGSR